MAAVACWSGLPRATLIMGGKGYFGYTASWYSLRGRATAEPRYSHDAIVRAAAMLAHEVAATSASSPADRIA